MKTKNNVKKIFEELKEKNLISKKRILKPSKNIPNFQAKPFSKKLLYNPSFSNMDNNSVRFTLLHEEGHRKRKSRTLPILLLSIVSSFFLYFLLIRLTNMNSLLVAFISLSLLLSIIKLFLGYMKEDELDADLWASIKLIENFGIDKPSKLLKKALNSLKEVKPKQNFISKLATWMRLYKIFNYHPSDKERINCIKSIFENENKK